MKRNIVSLLATLSLLAGLFSPVLLAQSTTTKTTKSTVKRPKTVVDRPMKLDRRDLWEAGEDSNDPDLPPFMRGVISKEEYMKRRSTELGQLRGVGPDGKYDVRHRLDEIAKLERDESARLTSNRFNPRQRDAILAAWSAIGPAPIPNGQTTTTTSSVSGRVTAIDVHPTNPNIAYVGTAQGGLYRTTDGGANWTPLMDTAGSLAIGAVTINPLTPSQVFVGTGESNRSADSYAGVGLYRIDNADGASPTINGPFATRVQGTGTAVSNGIAFTNTSITKILVDPTDQNKIFVGNTTGVYGLSGSSQGTGGANGFVGLWFSENAQSGTITFSRVNGLPGGGASSVTDIVYEPGSNNNMLIATTDLNTTVDDSGIYRTTNSATASVAGNISPTYTRVITLTATQSNGGVVAMNKVGPTVTAFAAYQGSTSGTVVKSTDGGATWGAAIASAAGFCGSQCFYDTAIAIDPNDANYVYLAGSATGASSRIFARSTDGGATFNANEVGLHADSHAIGIAPSNPSVVYTGNDGGIFSTADVKVAGNIAWTSRNTGAFLATQFMSLDTHPTNPFFSIGGTQDNGTNWYKPDGTWNRVDFGDGGYAVIDQNAADTTNVRMYHTYFNQTNAMGYARVTSTASASDGNWTLFGCGFGGSVANGMTCTATAIRFYAPMERGPGNPNTLYFGSDVLYRSGDGGTTVSKVSQEPITTGVSISAIGIAPTDDNVRVVGLSNGGLFGTTTGASPLVDLDPSGTVPNSFISRVTVDPNNANTAYVTISAFGAGLSNVWKTTSLNAFGPGIAPTWTNASVGLPSVPVNDLVVDPTNSNNLYAGTDIGVYASTDGGTSWTPFGTGLPRVAVFAMTIAPGSKLRIATHGKGLYDIALLAPTAAGVPLGGRVIASGGSGIGSATVTITGPNGDTRSVRTNQFGNYRFENVLIGETYTVSVSAKGISVAPRVVALDEGVENFDFIVTSER